MRHSTENYEPDTSRGHEYGDLPLKPILKQIFWFFGFVVASIIVTAGIFQIMVPGGFASSFQPDDVRRRLPPAPLPRLQSNFTAKTAIADMRQDEALALSSSTTDPKTGRRTIPIDEAIRIVGQNGLPKWAKTGPATQPSAGGRP